MTAVAYDRRTKTIGADSRNTDSAGQVFTTDKIEKLPNGWYFLGSGHCLTINKVRDWACNKLSPKHVPDFDELFGERSDDFSMSCLIISPDGEKVILVDDEMAPMLLLDDLVAVGSGGPYARGALEAGATMEQAIAIAIRCDGNCGGPIRTLTLTESKHGNRRRR